LQRCLAELAVLVERPAAPVEVLDVGCGSGVLGIAAVLLGAHSAVAIDIDPAAVAATTANAVVNGVAGQITASALPLREVKGTFDLVVANLLAPVFDDLGVEITHRVRPGGYLVAAGVLRDQADRVVGNAPNCEVIRTVALGDWIIITLRRR
jgi:ribosomal protein L11 methyltransferase